MPVDNVEKANFSIGKHFTNSFVWRWISCKKDASNTCPRQQLNAVGLAFTIHKNDDAIREKLQAAQLESNDIDALINGVVNFSGFGRLSEKSM
jgi:hypothetical protein